MKTFVVSFLSFIAGIAVMFMLHLEDTVRDSKIKVTQDLESFSYITESLNQNDLEAASTLSCNMLNGAILAANTITETPHRNLGASDEKRFIAFQEKAQKLLKNKDVCART
ncbi:MAG: hypothetical protein SVW51_15550 [Pseudomonadota bacterium]|jgi:hypothetical protein|nr:hypothetical protein [Pseudomonadota bacterium]